MSETPPDTPPAAGDATSVPAIEPPATVVLTGISGFIAKRIAADLLEAGYRVRGTVRSLKRADEVRAAVLPALSDTSALDTRLTFAEADLTSDDGWMEAMDGAEALLHTASPFPLAQPKNEDEVIRPAVDGTLRALRAAQASGVRRVVLTSSIAAIMYSDRPSEGDVYTEKDWTDTAHPTATAYVKSKTLAERAAWDFVAEHPEMALTTINPGLVAGRPMDAQYGTSLRVVERFFSGKDPVVPNFGLPVVDVEDVSAMHVAALERPHSAGSRYIAAEDFVMAPQMARWLAEAYPDRRIATRVAPKWLLRALSLFDAEVRTVLPTIDEVKAVSSAKAQDELGIAFTPSKDAILKSAAFIDRRDAA